MTLSSHKPHIFKRPGEWCCIVRGNANSRMGVGSTPSAAYASWEFWNGSLGEQVARWKAGSVLSAI